MRFWSFSDQIEIFVRLGTLDDGAIFYFSLSLFCYFFRFFVFYLMFCIIDNFLTFFLLTRAWGERDWKGQFRGRKSFSELFSFTSLLEYFLIIIRELPWFAHKILNYLIYFEPRFLHRLKLRTNYHHLSPNWLSIEDL